jgi:hypothetical protein
MKIRLLFIIISFCYSLFSCVNSERNTQRETGNKSDPSAKAAPDVVQIKIPEDISSSEIDLRDLIADIDFIALETGDSCVIGSINKVLTDDGYYIIHDKDNNKIFRFDSLGHFINQIGVTGRGPKEYTEPWDVSLDKMKKEVSVLDLSGRKIVKYKYDGSFAGKIPVQFLFTQHEYSDMGMVCFTYGSYNKPLPSIYGYKLVFSDELNRISGKAIKYNVDRKNSYTTQNPLRKFNDKIYYSDPFKNSVYLIDHNEAYPTFIIDFGKAGWDSNLDTNVLNDQEIRELLDTHEFFNGDYVVSDSFLFFQTFGLNKPGYQVYYSLLTGRMKYGYYFNDVESSKISGLLFNAPRWLKDDGRFIATVNPYVIKSVIKDMLQHKGRYISEKEKSILMNAKEEDNPILVIFSIKDF